MPVFHLHLGLENATIISDMFLSLMLTRQSLSITTIFALVIIGQIVLQLNLLEDSSFPSVSTMLPFKID